MLRLAVRVFGDLGDLGEFLSVRSEHFANIYQFRLLRLRQNTCPLLNFRLQLSLNVEYLASK